MAVCFFDIIHRLFHFSQIHQRTGVVDIDFGLLSNIPFIFNNIEGFVEMYIRQFEIIKLIFNNRRVEVKIEHELRMLIFDKEFILVGEQLLSLSDIGKSIKFSQFM